MINSDTISERITLAIHDSNLSQTELANRIGVKQPTIGQYISGRAKPSLETFAKLCQVLEIDPAYILGLTDIP